MMKYSILLSLSVLGISSATLQAATYTSNFSGLGVGAPLAGVDGWTQSSDNYVDPGDGTVYPWAYGTEVIVGASTIPAAAVGGYYNTDTPTVGGFYAAQSLSFDKGMFLNMKFAISDSAGFTLPDDPTVYGTERNSFRISVYNQSSEVFALVFDPVSNPDALTDTNDAWNVSSSSGGIQGPTIMAVYESGVYTLGLSLLPSDGNLNYSYSLTGGNTANAHGVLTGVTGEIDSLRIGIDPLAGQFGTNQMTFYNVATAVPEPSSLLLLASAAGGLVLRRRRL